MAQTFLEYFKILLPNFGFDILLLQKEYQKALRILKQHGNASYSELKDFISDCGHKKLYKAKNVFLWLGY